MEKNKKVIILTFLFLALVFALPIIVFGESNPVSLIISSSMRPEQIGSEMEVRLAVSARQPVNAFDVYIEYSEDRVEFVRASTADSIVSVWQSLPLAREGGILRLVGGMITPFSGENGKLISLIFRIKAAGGIPIVAQKADFALADGKGTTVSASVISQESASPPIREAQTETAPKISEAIVIEDPLTKTPFVSAKADNEGAVAGYMIRSREWLFWSDWQKTHFPVAIPKYAWSVQIAAIAWNGAESMATIYRQDIIVLKASTILATLVFLWYAIAFLKKKFRNSKLNLWQRK